MALQFNIDKWIKENLFNAVPVSIAVMDRNFNVLYANSTFEEMFGAWQDLKCYSIYKNKDSVCEDCKAVEAFKDGVPRVNEEIGYNKDNRLTYYIKHTVPVADESGEINFVVEMSTDITSLKQVRKERSLLFDEVPCSILLINKDFKIVRTNKRLRQRFGDIKGEYCYQAFKGRDEICPDCTALKSFEDSKTHTGTSIVRDRHGTDVHFQVTTIPLADENGKEDFVMEMAVDITQTLKLQKELNAAHCFMTSLIATSLDGIVGADDKRDVNILNPSARSIFNIPDSRQVTMHELEDMLPPGFIDQVSAGTAHVFLPETEIKTLEGIKVPARLSGVQLNVEDKYMGMALSIQDLREIKHLEKEKLEAERLAAVGQTVAGLAHGIKNLVTGLDGGMYMLNSGINKGKIERVQEGIEMLERNVGRISTFVKQFLSFSKGRKIQAKLCDPAQVAREVVDLYKSKAQKSGIKLSCAVIGEVKEAPIDFESMHECLTNLVGNAIDACLIGDNEDSTIIVSVSEDRGTITYDVKDNGCGMDYDIKKKVFTNFFTTKGLGGTGLGLLTTSKIVQEHGGKINMESRKGEGTTFSILLPRKLLPEPVMNS